MSSTLHQTRIGLLTWDYDPPKGGLGRAMQWSVKLLHREHIRTFVASSASGGGPDDDSFFPWTHRMGGHVLFSLLSSLKVQKWIRRRRVSLLLLPCGPGGVFLLCKPKDCCSVAIVYHTYRQQAALVPGQFWKWMFVPLERRTLRIADRILCYSNDTRRVLLEQYGIPADRISLLPQLFDIDDWVPLEGVRKQEGLCVCIARLEQRKGIELLLRAWERIQKSHPQATLVIVGKGVLAQRTDRWIEGLHLRAERREDIPRPDLIALVQRSELLLSPSYFEGFGLTIAEAMVAGTTVIAHNTDGARSLIDDGATGVLVPLGDEESWARALTSLLGDSRQRAVLAERAQHVAMERFERSAAEQAHLAYLQELCGDRHDS